VPGVRTSAFLTLSLLLGDGAGDRGFTHEAMLFSDVPGAVLDGRADAGLLIHEAQLTFAEMGLRKVVDLGEWWTGREGLPLPLGLNVLRRDLDDRFGAGSCETVSRVLSASVDYAIGHGDESRGYLLLHSEGRPEWRDAALVDRYLSMYVSRLSADMGPRGEAALRRLIEVGVRGGYLESAGELTIV
jgi:1,4-dihydroxy-6-naphthoate synthase